METIIFYDSIKNKMSRYQLYYYLDFVGYEGGCIEYGVFSLLPVAHLFLDPGLAGDVAAPSHQVVEAGTIVLNLRHFLEGNKILVSK